MIEKLLFASNEGSQMLRYSIESLLCCANFLLIFQSHYNERFVLHPPSPIRTPLPTTLIREKRSVCGSQKTQAEIIITFRQTSRSKAFRIPLYSSAVSLVLGNDFTAPLNPAGGIRYVPCTLKLPVINPETWCKIPQHLQELYKPPQKYIRNHQTA